MSMELLDNIRAVNTAYRLAHTLRNEVAYRDSESLTELKTLNSTALNQVCNTLAGAV